MDSKATLDKNIPPKLIQDVCREEMKEILLQDILRDMNICKLEGFNWKEYILDLIKMLKSILKVE